MRCFIDVVKGFLIGVANIIPGMSGGTLALIMGVYDRIIEALHNISMSTVASGVKLLSFKKEAFSEFGMEMKKIDAGFLICLGFGAVVAILSLSRFMDYVLKEHHSVSYAFFFGLVLMSMVFPYKYLKRRSWREFISFVMAAIFTVSLTFMVSDAEKIDKAERKYQLEQQEIAIGAIEQKDAEKVISLDVPLLSEMILMFAAAALAISAMVLPGISGSFVLLLLGVYFKLLSAINDREVILLLCFAAGCVVGLLVFSRVMDFLLKRFYNVTMSFMIGLMAGSLYVLWPFKDSMTIGNEIIYLGNVFPATCGKVEIYSAVAAIIGVLVIMSFYIFELKHEAKEL